MTLQEAILTDVLADESEWWAGELQTVTGFFRAEYEALAKRICSSDYSFTDKDRKLLYGAGMALTYCEPPHLEALNVKSIFGDDWVEEIEDFIFMMKGKK